MCNGENGHRHLGALHILYHQQPTELDRRFIEIRQWLTATTTTQLPNTVFRKLRNFYTLHRCAHLVFRGQGGFSTSMQVITRNTGGVIIGILQLQRGFQ